MATNAELTENTRRRIIDVFWEQLLSVGLTEINVRSLMKQVGMNRSTFYEHFSSISDLLQKASEDLMESIIVEVAALADNYSSDEPAVFFGRLQGIFRDKGRRIIFMANCSEVPDFLPRYRDAIKPTVFKVFRIECEKEDEDLIMAFIMSVLMAASNNLIEVDFEKDVSSMMAKVHSMVVHGIGQYMTAEPVMKGD